MKSLRVKTAGRQHDVDVAGVRAHHRYQPLGPFDARLQQDLVPGGVAVDEVISRGLQAGEQSRGVLDDHQGQAPLFELPGDNFADAPEAADDVMIFQPFDVLDQFAPSQDRLELPFDHHPGQRADDIEHDPHPGEDQHHVVDPPDPVQRMGLAVAHGGEGGHRHVQGVEETPPFQPDEAQAADQQEGQQAGGPLGNFTKGYHASGGPASSRR